MSVYVVSHHNEGSGGFEWYWTLEDAEKAYDHELGIWAGGNPPTRVRLVEYPVDTVPGPSDAEGRQRLTNEIDADIDQVEVYLPAIKERTAS